MMAVDPSSQAPFNRLNGDLGMAVPPPIVPPPAALPFSGVPGLNGALIASRIQDVRNIYINKNRFTCVTLVIGAVIFIAAAVLGFHSQGIALGIGGIGGAIFLLAVCRSMKKEEEGTVEKEMGKMPDCLVCSLLVGILLAVIFMNQIVKIVQIAPTASPASLATFITAASGIGLWTLHIFISNAVSIYAYDKYQHCFDP